MSQLKYLNLDPSVAKESTKTHTETPDSSPYTSPPRPTRLPKPTRTVSRGGTGVLSTRDPVYIDSEDPFLKTTRNLKSFGTRMSE